MACEISVRFGVPSGHGREDVRAGSDVSANADEHVDHRRNAGVLPVDAGRRLLAMD